MTVTHVPVLVCGLDCESCMDEVARTPGGVPFIAASTSHEDLWTFKHPASHEESETDEQQSALRRARTAYTRFAFEEGSAWLSAVLAAGT